MSSTADRSFTLFGTTFQGDRVTKSPASEDARKHIFRSLAIAAASPPVVAILLIANDVSYKQSMLLAVGSAYVAWASYWGTVSVLRGLTSIGEEDGAAKGGFRVVEHFSTHHLGIYGLVLIPTALGVVFGTLGGGIYEYLRQRRIVIDPNSQMQ